MKQYSFLTELNAQWKRALHGSAIGGLAGGGIGAAGRVGYNLIKGNKWDDSLDKYTLAGAGLGAAAGGMHGYFKKPNLNKMANQQSAGKAKQQTAQQTGQKAAETAVDVAAGNALQTTQNLSPRERRLLNSKKYQQAVADANKQFAGTGVQVTQTGKYVVDPKLISDMPKDRLAGMLDDMAKRPRTYKRLDNSSRQLLYDRARELGLNIKTI